MLKSFIIYMANNIAGLLIIYITSLIGTGFIFSVLESTSFLNGFYWAVTTALSIGYGDILPTKTATKIIFMIMSNIWLLLIIPSIVANIIITALKDVNEFTDAEQEEIKENLNFLTGMKKFEILKSTELLSDKEKRATGLDKIKDIK